MNFIPLAFPIVILVIISPAPEFVISLTVTLHNTHLTRQEVDQTFITTCKSRTESVNFLINKRLKVSITFLQTWQQFSLYLLDPTRTIVIIF